MRGVGLAVAFALVRAACVLGGEAPEELPPVPQEAMDAYRKGQIASEQLLDKAKTGEAATADEWAVAVGFFTEAQHKAPTSPAVLKALALAHEFRGAYVAAKAWFNAYLAAFPRAQDRLGVVQRTRDLDLKAQVVISKVFAEALRAAALVPQPAPVEMGGQVTYIVPNCMINGRGHGGAAWTTGSMSVHYRTEVMFLQADAGDVEGAFITAKALADGIRQGSWDRPTTDGQGAFEEWNRRFSVWKAGHDAMAAAGDWAGAMALYAEHVRVGLLYDPNDQKWGGMTLHSVFGDQLQGPRALEDEIVSKIDEGRGQPVALSDWLALANEVTKASDEPGLELRLKQIRGSGLKPAELVMAVARTAVPIGQALLKVRALERRQADQTILTFRRRACVPNNEVKVEAARQLLAECPELISLRCSPNGETVLFKAAAGGDPDVIALLLAKGADAKARSYYDCTPLHYAAGGGGSGGSCPAARALLAKGADVNARFYDGRTPLHFAAKSAGAAVIELLLKAGASVKATASDGCTPLHEATSCADPRVIKLLLDAGADVNAKTRAGKTVLDLARERKVTGYSMAMNGGRPSSPGLWAEAFELLSKAADK